MMLKVMAMSLMRNDCEGSRFAMSSSEQAGHGMSINRFANAGTQTSSSICLHVLTIPPLLEPAEA